MLNVKFYISYLAVAALCVIASPVKGYTQVEAPQIQLAQFDQQGKLKVKARFNGIEGCYLVVNGGLTRATVDTGITSIQLSAAQAHRGYATLKTKKRYYCKQRKLYVNTELVCLNEIVGSAVSDTEIVTVPQANLRR